MRVNFYIKNTISKSTTIYCICTFDGNRISFSTEISIAPSNWNKDKQRVKSNISYNNKLQEIESVCMSTYDRMKIFGAVNKDKLKRNIISGIKKQNLKDEYLLPYYYKWATTRTLTKKEPSRQCLQCYNAIASYADKTIQFSEITDEWIEGYLLYLNDRNYSLNYIGTHLKNLKAVMNKALKDGLHSNTSFRNFKKMEEDSDAIYLNREEIHSIEQARGLNSLEDRARDLFLIGYYTATRFSDYSRLDMSMIQDGLLKLRTQKTDADVVIPANPKLIQILIKYGGKAPKMDVATLNRVIKTVCEKAEILDIINHTITIGGKTVTTLKSKYDLVSSHTARRSGATNMYLLGIKPEQIMLLTGHKSYTSFKRYIRIGKLENAQMLKENEFFL